MKNLTFLLLVSMLFIGCKDPKTNPDPNKKNWYVYKHKTRGICTDPHWGKWLEGAKDYDVICEKMTKAEAEKCWNEKCELKEAELGKNKCPSLLYSDNFQAVFIRETNCGSLKDVHFVYRYNGSCTETKAMVNMEKYIVLDSLEICKDDTSKRIYTYKKKED